MLRGICSSDSDLCSREGGRSRRGETETAETTRRKQEGTNMNRRDFVQGAVAGALASAPAQSSQAAAAASKMIGIQVGAVSFVDEGVNPVLELFQQAASVN